LQPWRWQWLGTVVAAVLLPEIVRALWHDALTKQRATEPRTTALLLISAWVFASNAYALFASTAACSFFESTVDFVFTPGAWLTASVFMLRTTQISSANEPTLGSIALNERPDRP